MIKRIVEPIFAILTFPFLLLVALFSKRQSHPRLLWLPVPIINNKHWSEAMREGGYTSQTLMETYYSINSREDYDLYLYDFIPDWLPRFFAHYWGFIYSVLYFDIVHIPFSGGALGSTSLKRLEGWLYRLAGCKIVCLPYGADAYICEEIADHSLQHALLQSYPNLALESQTVRKNIDYWSFYADAIPLGFMVDSFPRWDVVYGNFIGINTDSWPCKEQYSNADGIDETVKVYHTPNHRGFKGTEFIIDAVETLQQEGLRIELILLEGRSNIEVQKALLDDADILCEQLIAPGHGLSAIEGMATGLPVMSNLCSDHYLNIFKRYSFLNECPIIPTSPENLIDNLRLLVRDPQLRQEMGACSRRYAEKYHSYEAIRHLFSSIYRKIYFYEEIDLMKLMHPLYSSSDPINPPNFKEYSCEYTHTATP